MQRWVSGCERSWVSMIDTIFVGSEYHKKLLEDLCGYSLNGKVYPIGYPVDKRSLVKTAGIEPIPFRERKPIIVFPHRLDKEKNPQIFDALKDRLIQDGVEATFVKTKEVCSNKAEYYNLLARAKVSISTADQETFGIAMVESALMGALPIAPNRLSYVDTMPAEWRYDDFEELVHKTKKALQEKSYSYHNEDVYSLSTIVSKVLVAL